LTDWFKSVEKDVADIIQEYIQARTKHRKIASFHEGYAILKEEVDEMWDAIKQNKDPVVIKNEARQVAAMALAIIVELDD